MHRSIRPCVHPSIHQSLYPFTHSIHPSIRKYVPPSIHPSKPYLAIHPFYPSIHQSVRPSDFHPSDSLPLALYNKDPCEEGQRPQEHGRKRRRWRCQTFSSFSNMFSDLKKKTSTISTHLIWSLHLLWFCVCVCVWEGGCLITVLWSKGSYITRTSRLNSMAGNHLTKALNSNDIY